jgi:hypothetical protein
MVRLLGVTHGRLSAFYWQNATIAMLAMDLGKNAICRSLEIR